MYEEFEVSLLTIFELQHSHYLEPKKFLNTFSMSEIFLSSLN